MKLFLEYIGLCFFKNNPTELHPSTTFVRRCIIFYLLSGFLVEGNISDFFEGPLEVVMRAIFAISLIAALVYKLKQWSLYEQLLTAIFMCENVMMTLGLLTEILENFLEHSRYEDAPLYLAGLLVIWYITTLGYIIRQMFSFNMKVSVIMAFSYFVITYGMPMMIMDSGILF